jgi:hypothetical protein
MRRVVALENSRAYFHAMASAVLRLFALFALVLMPLSMASAPASAHPAAATPAGHCDDQPQPAKAPAGPQMHCTACSALPANDAPTPVEEMAPQATLLVAPVSSLTGIEPDIATPPPKLV